MNTIIGLMKKSLFGASRARQGVKWRPVSVRGGGQKGFSLIELLIAMAIATLVSAAIYSMYYSFFQSSQKQDLTLEAEQNARAGAEVMERELQNAGYLAGTINAVTKATATNMEFIYTDPSDASTSATAGDKLQVEYIYDSAALTVQRKVQNLVDGTSQTGQLISDVKSFAITYYDSNGAVITPTDQTTRNNIRYADINMVTQTSAVPLGATVKSTFALTLHLKLRNIDIAQAASDTSAPDAPTINSVSDGVRDPGQCGRLSIKWTPSTAGDVAGYKIYYGTVSGDYIGVVSIARNSLGDGSTYSCTAANGPCTLFPSLSPFQYSPSNGTAIPYYFAIKSYDNSMNYSPYSTEITGAGSTGTLAGSNALFGSGSNDTTVNPKKPGTPSGLIGANGNADGKINLSWSAYDTATYPGVTDMRIYRMPYVSGATLTYPISPAYYVNSVPIGTTTYTDSTGLTGCDIYRYLIAPVNCDNSLIALDTGDVAGATQDKTPYYESYNYVQTYGDGASGNVFTNIADSPSGSDTAPLDTVVPDEPVPFGVRAGYKRVAVQFTQPPASDIAQTCVYIATGSTAPVVNPDPLSWDAKNCSNLSAVPTANRVPEYEGVFTKPTYSGSYSFWNNSASGAVTTTPSLAESGTYSYTAVAYDKCGNRSTSASSTATTTLCGEDPPLPSATKPPAVTDVVVSGCGGSVTNDPQSMSITWTPITSDLNAASTYNNPYDLAGYRLFKSDVAGFGTATLLNTAAPYWEPPYNDATTADGDVVYYRVYTSDCPFEKGDDTGGTYPTAAQMMSKLSYAGPAAPVYPARLVRDMKYPVTRTNHREVLTGIMLDGSGNSTPKTAYTHDTVYAFLYNTGNSASSMTITGMSLSWVNSNAYLSKVKIGGGSSGVSESTVATLTTGQTSPVTGNDPYSMEANNISFGAGKQIPGGSTSRNTPIKLYFTDNLGNAADMRSDQLLITLNIKNDSTGTTTCKSYMSKSTPDVLTGMTVPLGPIVTSMTQNLPSSPTFPYSVPGTSGLETVPTNGTTLGQVQVAGNSDVKVTATIAANTYDEVTDGVIPISSAKLYYAVTDITTGTAPDSSSSGTYTAVNMSLSSGSWGGTIPSQDTSSSNKRVWYYVVGIDADGNYDILPKKAAGKAVYDQKAANRCDLTPNAPTGLSFYNISTGNVAFSWPRVTTYTSGGAINTASDPIFYRVYRRNSTTGTFTKVYDVPDNAPSSWVSVTPVSPATSSYYICNPSWAPGSGYCIYWDYVDALNTDISYYVQTKNSCSADLNLSSATLPFRECQGATSAALSVLPVGPINVGDSYTVTVDDCTLAATPNNTTVNTVTEKNISSRGGVYLNKVLTETSMSSGAFSTTVKTQRTDAGSATEVYVNPTDTINDTVTISCPSTAPGCTGPPTSVTITVKAVACNFTPAAPTGLTGATTLTGATGANTNNANANGQQKALCTTVLSWTASTSPDVTSYEIFKRTNPTATFPVTAYAIVSATASPWTDPVTYTSTGSTCTLKNYYYIKAVDSCSTGALKSAGAPNTSPGAGPY